MIDLGGQIKCIDKAYSGPFLKAESERICAGAHDEGPALCAIKAYGGPFSKEEALRLCKSTPALVLRSLNLLEQSSDIQEKIRSMK